jgi:SAM-dependent methyltransferase
MERRVLIIGAGSSKVLRAPTPLSDIEPQITTLDMEPRHKPDVVWDLNILDWPFGDNEFHEIHAYEVLEHLGEQGNAKAFFAHFGEIYRILKPGGHLAASVPRWDSLWAFGDPSHRRVINEGSLTFLDQTQYALQVGKTAMTDFRSLWSGDFEAVGIERTGEQLYFILKAHKPARA